jgi:hypothetical protein
MINLVCISFSPLDVAICQLLIVAFFNCRSCECCTMEGIKRHMNALCLRNVRFFLHNKELGHRLSLANTVTLDFEYQKNDEHDESVTQQRTCDPLLHPVRQWADVVQWCLTYPGRTHDIQVNTVLVMGRPILFTANTALAKLRATVVAIGKDVLGFASHEIGFHSLRSGAGMAMYLYNIPVYTIMLIGRWSSDAFMRYTRCQVKEFSAGVSSAEISSPDVFTIPQNMSAEDPRTTNHQQNFSAQNNCGLASQSRSTVHPAFTLNY